MSRAFVVSDTHFGHRGILRFCPKTRPFRDIHHHDEALVDNWNSVVGTRDAVYHLGDVAWSVMAIEALGLYRGRKILIKGNHDRLDDGVYAKYFERVYGALAKSLYGHRVIMTHIPIHPSEFYRWEFNLHGHLHEKVIPDHRYVNCSVEQIDLTPQPIESLLSG